LDETHIIITYLVQQLFYSRNVAGIHLILVAYSLGPIILSTMFVLCWFHTCFFQAEHSTSFTSVFACWMWMNSKCCWLGWGSQSTATEFLLEEYPRFSNKIQSQRKHLRNTEREELGIGGIRQSVESAPPIHLPPPTQCDPIRIYFKDKKRAASDAYQSKSGLTNR
jgi:hypothetical protein